MWYILLIGMIVFFYLAAVLFILGLFAAGKELSEERLSTEDLWFISGTCLVIGFCLLIMFR